MKEITEAPTAVIAIMVQSYAVNYGPEYVIVLSFLSGCFELIAGLLNLGKKNWPSCDAKIISSKLKELFWLISRIFDGLYFGTSYFRLLFRCSDHRSVFTIESCSGFKV